MSNVYNDLKQQVAASLADHLVSELLTLSPTSRMLVAEALATQYGNGPDDNLIKLLNDVLAGKNYQSYRVHGDINQDYLGNLTNGDKDI